MEIWLKYLDMEMPAYPAVSLLYRNRHMTQQAVHGKDDETRVLGADKRYRYVAAGIFLNTCILVLLTVYKRCLITVMAVSDKQPSICEYTHQPLQLGGILDTPQLMSPALHIREIENHVFRNGLFQDGEGLLLRVAIDGEDLAEIRLAGPNQV